MSAKILQMPKSNQHLWDDLFNGFINQIDRAKAHFKVSSGADAIKASVDSAGYSCGHGQAKADAHLEPVQPGRATAGIAYHGNLARYIDENAVVPAKPYRGECIVCGVVRYHCKHGKCMTCEGCAQCGCLRIRGSYSR